MLAKRHVAEESELLEELDISNSRLNTLKLEEV